MRSITLPLSLFANPDYLSLQERRAREVGRAQAQSDVTEIETFKSSHDSWVSSLQSYDNQERDKDGREGKVSVENVRWKGDFISDFNRGYLSGELTALGDHVQRADYDIKNVNDSDYWVDHCSMERTTNETTYSESTRQGDRSLIIDHKRGTLTFENNQATELA